ncbi:hypothetical protein [Candidatus Poriferisodalis multihospitum]|uniref:hypothetical protein n=1 Tax=Candidatus Poriferisodalis multihospitum TaxID=2983191 RepID=UPI002B258972|nr:hypothetical protein [Candidatus Poriferisodalis multihospitum]
MDLGALLAVIVTAVVTASVSLVVGKLSAVRRGLASGVRRVVRAFNYVRRFVFASRRTRRHARADFVSRRNGLSLPALGITLFRWYDRHPDLIEYMLRVVRKNRSETVRREVAELLWVNKPASQLRVNDIVHRHQYTVGHVLWVEADSDSERILAVLDATASTEQTFQPMRDETVRVVRGEWCPIDDCRYCEMTPRQIETIGAMWAKANEAKAELRRLKREFRSGKVNSAEEARSMLAGLADSELIARYGHGRSSNSQSAASGVELPAGTVGEVISLADSGWSFHITRLAEHARFCGVLVSDWLPPENAS